MRSLEQLLAALNVDEAARVSIATYAALAANVRLLVDAEEAELLRAHGAREHVVPPPATPNSPCRRPRRPPENERR